MQFTMCVTTQLNDLLPIQLITHHSRWIQNLSLDSCRSFGGCWYQICTDDLEGYWHLACWFTGLLVAFEEECGWATGAPMLKGVHLTFECYHAGAIAHENPHTFAEILHFSLILPYLAKSLSHCSQLATKSPLQSLVHFLEPWEAHQNRVLDDCCPYHYPCPNTPSSLGSRFAMCMACSELTGTTSSTSDTSITLGTKPAPMPETPEVTGRPYP